MQLSALLILKIREDWRKDLKMNKPCKLKYPLLSVERDSVGSKLRSDEKSINKSSNLQLRYILTGISYIFRRHKLELKRANSSNIRRESGATLERKYEFSSFQQVSKFVWTTIIFLSPVTPCHTYPTSLFERISYVKDHEGAFNFQITYLINYAAESIVLILYSDAYKVTDITYIQHCK